MVHPVHGEYRHLGAHAASPPTVGVAADHINVREDGGVIIVSDTCVKKGKPVPVVVEVR